MHHGIMVGKQIYQNTNGDYFSLGSLGVSGSMHVFHWVKFCKYTVFWLAASYTYFTSGFRYWMRG